MQVILVRVEMSDKWVRAQVGGLTVVDTREPMLFWEQKFPVPGYAFAQDDVRMDLLVPVSPGPDQAAFFFRPKGPVKQWFDLHVDGRVFAGAAWIRDEPEVADRIVFTWHPDVMDKWLEEDEVVQGHPRDPHKRVEALPSSRHVNVTIDGVQLADTTDPVLLFETYLPTRFYIPRADVDFAKLSESANRTHCPYKGQAEEYWDAPGMPGVAWSYPHPYPAVGAIKGRVSFYNELVDITADGVALPRPKSTFSNEENRPSSL